IATMYPIPLRRTGVWCQSNLLFWHAGVTCKVHSPDAILFPAQHINPMALELLLSAIPIEQSDIVYSRGPCSVFVHKMRLNGLARIAHDGPCFEQPLISFDNRFPPYQDVLGRK